MPFLGLLFLLVVQTGIGLRAAETVVPAIVVFAIGIGPSALVGAQTVGIMRRNMQADYARTLVAVGATPLYQRTRLLHNVTAEMIPSLEKVLTSMIAALLFAEPVLGLSGFGTLAMRAIRRSDTDLLLGATLVIALAVGLMRLIALFIRRHYGLRV